MEQEIQAASTFNQLAEIFKQHESETEEIAHTMTYNPKAKAIIIKTRDTLKKEARKLMEDRRFRANSPIRSLEAEELRRLSRYFAISFPGLSNSFSAWKRRRLDLIRKTETSANRLQWTVVLGSLSRIFTSTADIVATCMRSNGSEKSSVNFTLDYSPIVGFASLFFQVLVSSHIFDSVKTSIAKDKELFQPIKEWFEQSQELDTAVRNFFPYGIDSKIVAKIEKNAKIPDESEKIFISIVASNVGNNIGLLRNRDFLSKADMFSTSEAGSKWYRKILFEMDPLHIECFKSDLENQIKEMKSSHTISKAENIVYSTLPLQTRMVNFKIFFNVMAIFSAVCSLLNEKGHKDSETLREFAEKARDELDAVADILDLLNPSGLEIEN